MNQKSGNLPRGILPQSARRTRGAPKSSLRKKERREIASDHISKLLEMAVVDSNKDLELSKRYAELAWQISTRFNVRLKADRRYYCRYCKTFIAIPGGARYRIGKGSTLKITCLKCGKTYRKKLLRKEKSQRVHKRLNSASERRR